MVSRRRFLGLSAAAVSAPVIGYAATSRGFASGGASPSAAATPTVRFVNSTGQSDTFAYVHANMPGGGQGFLNPSTGRLDPIPNPSDTMHDLSGFIAERRIPFGQEIPLNDHLSGGRIYFSLGESVSFFANPNAGGAAGAVVQPSAANPDDASYNISWDYCEFTYIPEGIWGNITCVDGVGLPIALTLTPGSAAEQHVGGIPEGGTAAMAERLKQAGGDWGKCALYDGDRLVRVSSPAKLPGLGTEVFAGHYGEYVDQVWQKYRAGGGEDLRIALGDVWPDTTVVGRTQGDKLVFEGITDGSPNTFDKPGTGPAPAEADIFGCDGTLHGINATQQGRIAAVLGAAFCRTTLLSNPSQPDATSADFYTNAPVYEYARLVHEMAADGRAYAFPYDDVTPTRESDKAGAVHTGGGGDWSLTVTVKRPA
ncbi:glycoside hydrolase family 64 protein [Streptomyces carminius]|uniref:glycoside hydrolase family 64 protein n=1 Tax=Streptomyces carminius TaxID=2665496 RepID=UPI0013044E58|nr:beta-1,3-glucanase family protein [Streptomyces carminius]